MTSPNGQPNQNGVLKYFGMAATIGTFALCQRIPYGPRAAFARLAATTVFGAALVTGTAAYDYNKETNPGLARAALLGISGLAAGAIIGGAAAGMAPGASLMTRLALAKIGVAVAGMSTFGSEGLSRSKWAREHTQGAEAAKYAIQFAGIAMSNGPLYALVGTGATMAGEKFDQAVRRPPSDKIQDLLAAIDGQRPPARPGHTTPSNLPNRSMNVCPVPNLPVPVISPR